MRVPLELRDVLDLDAGSFLKALVKEHLHGRQLIDCDVVGDHFGNILAIVTPLVEVRGWDSVFLFLKLSENFSIVDVPESIVVTLVCIRVWAVCVDVSFTR